MKHILAFILTLLAFTASIAQADLLDDMQQAIKNGNTDVVQELLGKGFDANATDPDGNTLLIQAAREGQGDIVRALVDAGAQVNLRNRFGETALMLAVFKGHKEIALYLLDKGADVKQKGWTPLLYAAFGGQVEMAQILLARGADPNERSDNGTTPLMLAAKSGSVELVNLLLKAGANPLLKNADGKTAADWGKESKNTDAAQVVSRLFAAQDQAVEAVKAGQTDKLGQALSAGVSPNATDGEGNSLLLLAAREGLPAVVELLLQKGAKVDVSNAKGETPLLVASYRGHDDTVKVLLKYGASLKKEDADALLYATMNCWDGAAQVLVDNGADLNRQTPEGYTALALAARNGCTNIARLLLERGANEQLADSHGNTPFYWARQSEEGSGVADLLAANMISHFVRQWFVWMEQLADGELYLGNLDEGDLLMKMPDKTLHSRADFQKWYQSLRTTVASNTHLIGDIVVSKAADGHYVADFDDDWQVATYKGDAWEQRLRYRWELTLSPEGRVTIQRYVAEKEAPPPPNPAASSPH